MRLLLIKNKIKKLKSFTDYRIVDLIASIGKYILGFK